MTNESESAPILVTPSKEFLDAVKGLKKHDEDFYMKLDEAQRESEYAKEDKVYELGRKEGLGTEYIREILDKHHMVEMPCDECKQKQVGVLLGCNSGSRDIMMNEIPLCPECKEKRDYNEWKARCDKQRDEEMKKPMLQYCYKIRSEIPNYDLTWEQYKERDKAMKKLVDDRFKKIQQILDNPGEDAEEVFKKTGMYPGGLTKTQWLKKLKNGRRLGKQEAQEARADSRLRRNTPLHIFSNMIDKISCKCKAEEMRRGMFCNTCRLIVKVNDYTLDLFKKVAEGRD